MGVPEGPSEGPAAANVHPLRNRTFLIVWLGQSVSLIGSGISTIAVIWWVFLVTGSTILLAAVALASTIPRVVVGPFAGAYVDRWDRRKTMAVIDAVAGGATVVVALTLAANALEIWHLYAFGVIVGFGTIFHSTALLASVPNIVHPEQLSRGNSLMQLSHSVSGVVGPAVGGVLVVIVDVAPALLIDAGTFFFASATLLLLAFPSPRSTTKKTIAADIVEGFGFLRRRPALLTLLGLFAFINFFFIPLFILLPVVATAILGLGVAGFGFLQSSLFAGLLVGGLLFAAVKLRRHFGLYIAVAIVGLGLFYVLFGWSSVLVFSILSLAGIGFSVALASVSSSTIFQREVPLELQGRVFSARAVLAQGLQPIALATVGILAASLGVQTLLIWSGTFIAVLGVLSLASSGIRKL
ncbi:MAG: MFS transporter [Thermoplasmata archaeon]